MKTFREKLQERLGVAEQSFMAKVAGQSEEEKEEKELHPEMEKNKNAVEKALKKESSVSTDYVMKVANQCLVLSRGFEKMGSDAAPALHQDPKTTVPEMKPTTGSGIPVQGRAQKAETDATISETGSEVTVPENSIKTDADEAFGAGKNMDIEDVTGTAAKVARVFKIITASVEKDRNMGDNPEVDDNGQTLESAPNHPANMDTIQSAINYTKRDAKKPEKEQLSKLIEEPAQSKKTDPVLNDMFDQTEEAGAKIAAKREYLGKIASQGCTCGGSGMCGYCSLSQILGGER